jgi:hypothetical protein
MVSSVRKMKRQELLTVLERLRHDFTDDPAYQEIRKDLPKDWPV